MVRFRTIRQHRRRARAGQVAAVATVLGLLLVVTFLANYLSQQLPGQLTSAEFDHTLQVENQLSRLQASILALSHSVAPGLTLSTPVSLGAAAVPPFGPPAGGAIGPEASGARIATTYYVGTFVRNEPIWNTGSTCLLGGSGKCSSNGNIDTWNVTNQNGTNFTLTVNGNSNSIQYNITGNNDTINVDWTGGDTGFVNFIINGSNDVVTYNKGGSDTTKPTATFLFYGQNDVFNFNPAGSHSSKGYMKLIVAFVSSFNQICPYGNASRTDKIGTLAPGGSNLNMTVIWWNAVGYTSGPSVQTYPGGLAANETITWWNNTGVVSCAFTKAYASQYNSVYGQGILVHLYNRYLPPTDVVYDQGAVIVAQEGGSPIMLSPPALKVTPVPAGFAASLTLVNLVGNLSTEAGITTAAVSTQLLLQNTLNVLNGITPSSLTSPLFLNLTTAYPAAWISYFGTMPSVFPDGGSCVPITVIRAPYSCMHPPPGALVEVSAPLSVVQLTLTSITVRATIL